MLIVYFAVKAFSALYCLEAPLNCLSINEKNEEKILFCCFASKRNRISSKEEEEEDRTAGRGRFSIQKTKKKSNCSSAGHCLLDWDEPPQDPWPNVGEGVIRKERERKERPPKKKKDMDPDSFARSQTESLSAEQILSMSTNNKFCTILPGTIHAENYVWYPYFDPAAYCQLSGDNVFDVNVGVAISKKHLTDVHMFVQAADLNVHALNHEARFEDGSFYVEDGKLRATQEESQVTYRDPQLTYPREEMLPRSAKLEQDESNKENGDPLGNGISQLPLRMGRAQGFEQRTVDVLSNSFSQNRGEAKASRKSKGKSKGAATRIKKEKPVTSKKVAGGSKGAGRTKTTRSGSKPKPQPPPASGSKPKATQSKKDKSKPTTSGRGAAEAAGGGGIGTASSSAVGSRVGLKASSLAACKDAAAKKRREQNRIASRKFRERNRSCRMIAKDLVSFNEQLLTDKAVLQNQIQALNEVICNYEAAASAAVASWEKNFTQLPLKDVKKQYWIRKKISFKTIVRCITCILSLSAKK